GVAAARHHCVERAQIEAAQMSDDADPARQADLEVASPVVRERQGPRVPPHPSVGEDAVRLDAAERGPAFADLAAQDPHPRILTPPYIHWWSVTVEPVVVFR